MPISNRESSLRNVRFSISECWYFVRSRTDHTQVFQSRLLIFKQCVWIERARVNFVHDDRMTIAHFAEIVDRSFYFVRLCLSMLCSRLWYDFSAQEGRRFRFGNLHFVMCPPRSANAGILPNVLIWFCIMCNYVCRCFVRNYDMIYLRRKDADFKSGVFIS